MKRTLVASVVAAGLSVFAFAANADEHTISGGYAQSHMKFGDDKVDDHPKGLNLKYRYELDNNWGVISSFTYTYLGYEFYSGGRKVAKADIDYYSLMAGPTYRFNDYVSAYGMVGAARGKVKVSDFVHSESESNSKTSIGYGLGLQFNPMPNWTIDTSYEYSKLGETKVGTWVVGVGYRF
ncbi:Ail/Lom family outer membrane beta-barrel protein [Photorhabdus caribbeanensis]|uniref:Ail/Lom family outer membrane beta-barrel protein n=1 Tax=Photorhabdus caribbeanensis TaxID=1004165 RepID=UPI001BD413D6|nr:Ail/Lom family outer membrane beta-barrel protein [Photorhabdus caribbeanensis]MBS9425050.1 autotransporter outer membrane beta-barrel domain-containing protein [Photorhabdus caribbeanensis]